MRLTGVLNLPPRFYYWKDFGTSRHKPRNKLLKQMRHLWKFQVIRNKIAEFTLKPEQLPAGARVLEAEDFLEAPIDALTDDILRNRNDPTVVSHPWPYNIQLDSTKQESPIYNYTIDTRFFVPKDDCLVLTNTLLETELMEARPPVEPTSENVDVIERQFEWATSKDSILVRQPYRRSFPRIDQRPRATYGITKERKEVTVLNSFNDYSQSIIAQYYHNNQQPQKLGELLSRKTIGFPQCIVPILRDSRQIKLELCIDILSISRDPLPLINSQPQETAQSRVVDIKPRTWRSMLEQTRRYSPNWSFTLPRNSYPNTIHLASRIKRDHRDRHELMARSIVHSYGLAMQYARLKCYEKQVLAAKSDESKLASVVLQNPLQIESVRQHDDKDLLEEPIVLQSIAFDGAESQFYFTRFQLNTNKPDGPIKNQAWHSGPIDDLQEAFRYYLDFQSFDAKRANEIRSESASKIEQEAIVAE